MKRALAALPLLLLVLAGILLLASGSFDRLHPEQLVAHQRDMRAQLAAHPWLSRLTYVGLLTLVTATGVPGSIVVILAGGFAFGAVGGTLYSSVGLTLGSLILYLASRYAFGTGNKHPPTVIDKLHHGYEHHPVSYTLFLRFVPVLPFGLVTVCLAWLRCRLWLFLGATWLGGTTMLVFETLIGAGLGKALRTGDPIGLDLLLRGDVLLPLSAIALLSLLPLLVERIRRNRQDNKKPAS